MIRNRVEPKPLSNVKREHLRGVFGQFEDVIDSEIARHDVEDLSLSREKSRFFRYLKQRVDAAKFGAMQEFQLSDGKLNPDSDLVKYIDPTLWFESKIVLAHIVGLDRRPPLDILDIGTGPAHFPVVAEFYGHRVVGTDVPSRATGQLERGHLYDALGDIYQVRRIPLRIEKFTALPPFERRYDLVTAFLAAFNVDRDKKPWTIEAWNFFLADLRDNVLTERGEVFMKLSTGKLMDEVWQYLSDRAVFTNDQLKHIHIVDLSPFG